MIERVAMIFYNLIPHDGAGERPEWVAGGNSFKQDEARQYARAVIKAMREPTEAMIVDVEKRVEAAESLNGTFFVDEIWKAMIDFILDD